VLILGNSEAIAMAVEEGIGVGFVSSRVAAKLFQGRVAIVAVDGLSLSQDIFMVRHARRPATAVLTAFWNFIHDPANAPCAASADLAAAPAVPLMEGIR
jgi:DNA-binding transcriptional LysR family regulator